MTVDPVYSHRELRPQNLLLRLPADWDNAAIQTEPAKADPRNRSRRWFQFSMRSLLIVVALPAVVCGRRRATIDLDRQEVYCNGLSVYFFVAAPSGRFAVADASSPAPFIRSRTILSFGVSSAAFAKWSRASLE